MKQDRFLIGILLGIAVLILLALAVFSLRKDDQVYMDDATPQGVVHNYIVAAQKRDYEKAYAYLADLKGKPSYAQFQEAFVNHYIEPADVGIEILEIETVNDAEAAVKLNIIYGRQDPFAGGSSYVQYARLTRQPEGWKIKEMPYQLWSYEWYQPAK